MISDIYEDGCGNLYRGIWRVKFFRQEENLVTLFSPGRTILPRKNSPDLGLFEPGSTQAIESKDFLFLSPPFPGDLEKVRRLRIQTRSTHRYDPQTHLFTQKP